MGVNVDRLERDDYGETAGSFNVSGAVVLLVLIEAMNGGRDETSNSSSNSK